jgi:hypothetical protein
MGRVLCSVLYEGLPSFGLHMQHRQTTEKWVGRSTEEASEDVLHAACGQWITRKRLQHPPRRQEKDQPEVVRLEVTPNSVGSAPTIVVSQNAESRLQGD